MQKTFMKHIGHPIKSIWTKYGGFYMSHSPKIRLDNIWETLKNLRMRYNWSTFLNGEFFGRERLVVSIFMENILTFSDGYFGFLF